MSYFYNLGLFEKTEKHNGWMDGKMDNVLAENDQYLKYQ